MTLIPPAAPPKLVQQFSGVDKRSKVLWQSSFGVSGETVERLAMRNGHLRDEHSGGNG
jgi:hypothetical protein